VNTSGTVLERYGYDAYGFVRFMDGSFGSRAGSSYGWETLYGAYRWDSESGLYHVRRRYLHPRLGVWLSRDPVEYKDGLNLYTYVQNTPVKFIDSTGLNDKTNPCKQCGYVPTDPNVPPINAYKCGKDNTWKDCLDCCSAANPEPYPGACGPYEKIANCHAKCDQDYCACDCSKGWFCRTRYSACYLACLPKGILPK